MQHTGCVSNIRNPKEESTIYGYLSSVDALDTACTGWWMLLLGTHCQLLRKLLVLPTTSIRSFRSWGLHVCVVGRVVERILSYHMCCCAILLPHMTEADNDDANDTNDDIHCLAFTTSAGTVGMQLSLLDAMLRGRISDFGVALGSLPPAAEDPTNPLLLRLARPGTGEALRASLLQLVDQAAAARYTALPNALQACTTLDGAVQQFLLRMLMAKVTRYLSGVPTMAEWTSGAAEGPGGVKLPAFSVYPSAYITAVGEYLMMLPQLLEALEDAEGREQGGEEDVLEADAANEGEWLDKVWSLRRACIWWARVSCRWRRVRQSCMQTSWSSCQGCRPMEHYSSTPTWSTYATCCRR